MLTSAPQLRMTLTQVSQRFSTAKCSNDRPSWKKDSKKIVTYVTLFVCVCVLLGGGHFLPHHVPVVDVHLAPVRPQGVDHFRVTSLYRKHQCIVVVLERNACMSYYHCQKEKKDLIWFSVIPPYLRSSGGWCRHHKTAGSPWLLRGGSVWPTSVECCHPVW